MDTNSDNKEILDAEMNQNGPGSTGSQNIPFKTGIYLFILIVGSVFIALMLFESVGMIIAKTCYLIGLAAILNLVGNGLKWVWHKFKKNNQKSVDPYWFSFIQGSFVWWVMLVILEIVNLV